MNVQSFRYIKLIQIHSDATSRIKSDRFSTDLHQTRLKSFFRIDSDVFGLALIQISEKIRLVSE